MATIRYPASGVANRAHPYEVGLVSDARVARKVSVELQRCDATGAPLCQTVELPSGVGVVRIDVSALAPGDYSGVLRLGAAGAEQTWPISFHRLAEPVAEPVPFAIYAVPLPADDLETCKARLREVKACGINLICQHTGRTSFEEMSPAFDEAAKLGIRVMPSINLHLKPPELAADDSAVMARPDEPEAFVDAKARGACFASPAVRQLATERLTAELATLRTHPAVGSRAYYGDDFFMQVGFKRSGQDLTCYCARCRTAFKAATGLEPPVTAEAVDGVVHADHPWLLWHRFRCGDVYGGLVGRLDEARRAVDPDLAMGMIHGFPFAPFSYVRCGIYSPISMPLPAISSYAYPYLRSPRQDLIAHYEIGRMGHRDKPVWMLGAINSNYTNYPAWQVYQNFWNMLAAGYDLIALFAWHDFVSAEAKGITENIAACKQALAACGKAREWLFPVASQWQPLRAPAAALYSFTTESFDIAPENRGHAHLEALLALYRETLRKRAGLEVICEEEVRAGILDRYQAVCLPGVRVLPADVKAALDAYVAAGGTVLADHDILREFNPLRRGPLVEGALQVAPETAAAILRDRFPSEVTVDDEHVTMRRLRAGELEYVVLVNNYADQYWGFTFEYWDKIIHKNYEHMRLVREQAITTRMRFAQGGRWVADLASGEVLGSTDEPLEVTLEPSWGRALALLPCPSVRLGVVADGRVPQGGTARIHAIEARSDSGLLVRGAFAVEVKVFLPSGAADARSGFVTLGEGCARFDLPIAINDPAGDWTLRFTGGFPRQTVTRTLTVTPAEAAPKLLTVA